MGNKKGMTFIEILITIGVIAILALGVILIIDPGEQLARGRDNQREIHLNAVLHSVSRKFLDDRKSWDCGLTGPIPETFTSIGSGGGQYNLYSCIYPNYLSSIVFDPNQGYFDSLNDYDAGYEIRRDSVTGRVFLKAPLAELKEIEVEGLSR